MMSNYFSHVQTINVRNDIFIFVIDYIAKEGRCTSQGVFSLTNKTLSKHATKFEIKIVMKLKLTAFKIGRILLRLLFLYRIGTFSFISFSAHP